MVGPNGGIARVKWQPNDRQYGIAELFVSQGMQALLAILFIAGELTIWQAKLAGPGEIVTIWKGRAFVPPTYYKGFALLYCFVFG